MARGSGWRRWGAGTLGALGVYGTLAGLGLLPVPAAVVAVSLGIASNQLEAALLIALAISLAVNLALGSYFWRQRRRRPRRLGRPYVPWPTTFTDPNDLSTIALTSADVEAWWANAIRTARDRIGPDAVLAVERINLVPVFIVFTGASRAAGRTFSGSVVGPDPTHVSWWHIVREEHLPSTVPEPPLWRTDETWVELIKQAWIKERPVRSDWDLFARKGPDSQRFWRLVCRSYIAADDRRIPARSYRLVNGRLETSRIEM